MGLAAKESYLDRCTSNVAITRFSEDTPYGSVDSGFLRISKSFARAM